MSRQRVDVIDGPMPDDVWQRANREPSLRTRPELEAVALELLRHEPIFHRREVGRSRQDFEKMTAPSFWEVGASGRCRRSVGPIAEVAAAPQGLNVPLP